MLLIWNFVVKKSEKGDSSTMLTLEEMPSCQVLAV